MKKNLNKKSIWLKLKQIKTLKSTLKKIKVQVGIIQEEKKKYKEGMVLCDILTVKTIMFCESSFYLKYDFCFKCRCINWVSWVLIRSQFKCDHFFSSMLKIEVIIWIFRIFKHKPNLTLDYHKIVYCSSKLFQSKLLLGLPKNFMTQETQLPIKR